MFRRCWSYKFVKRAQITKEVFVNIEQYVVIWYTDLFWDLFLLIWSNIIPTEHINFCNSLVLIIITIPVPWIKIKGIIQNDENRFAISFRHEKAGLCWVL